MERVGIYGGSFDPPHKGHFQTAQFALDRLGLSALLMMPLNAAPHKDKEKQASSRERLEMIRLGMGEDLRLIPSDLEVRRGGVSYTWQTLQQVRSQYPGASPVLIMGSDNFLTLHQWEQTEMILQTADIAVCCRGIPGEKDAVETQKRSIEAMGGRVEILDNPVIDLSSSDVRRLIAFRCAGSTVPPGVLQYMEEQALYGSGRNLKNLPMEALEREVISLLKPSRVRHVLGCRDTALELAKRWGADPTDAARAGMLHDVTKALPGALQLTLCREYGIVLDKFSRQNPKTLHALTGSLVADRIFGENSAVVQAIRHHTTGKAGMNILEKIVYVADYMEPNRDFPGVEKLRELAFSDIDKALKLGLEMTLDMLRQREAEISPMSQQALDYLISNGV